MPHSPKVKGDKSTKVGGRRNAGSAAQKSSMASKPRGKPVTMRGGAKSYHNW
jgi:hypothetical protein